MAEVGAGMSGLSHPLYREDLTRAAASGVAWDTIDGSIVAVSGATGMVGKFLVDLLMLKRSEGLDVCVLALGRDESHARVRLPHFGKDGFFFEELDVSVPGTVPRHAADVVVHLASATHPRAYATQPVGTIASNVNGLQNLMGYVCTHTESPRFVFASSVEIYGENRGDVERFDESYCGYIDCNTLRAGYPEAKRLGEALCQAWAVERRVQAYEPRLPRIYGPTLLPSDTKALSQFLRAAVAGQDVVLKSEGLQEFSYLHVADAVTGLLWVLTHGKGGVAYNVADASGDVRLRDLAAAVARFCGVGVRFELPDETERAGYSTATKALMDGSRLRELGWRAIYGLEEGIERTVMELKSN